MTYDAKELKFFKTVRGSVPLAIKTNYFFLPSATVVAER